MAEPTVITCPRCQARFRLKADPGSAVSVRCPRCASEYTLRRRLGKLYVIIGDEERAFRQFLVDRLTGWGFEVDITTAGDEALRLAEARTPSLCILNAYMQGMLGVEVCERLRGDPRFADTKIILIGALFRTNRYRSNPANLYGADEYVEEIISADDFDLLLVRLFPALGKRRDDDAGDPEPESPEFEEARRLARIIVSDIVIYHHDRIEEGIRRGNVFEALAEEIKEGKEYYESRVGLRVRRETEYFLDTLNDFVRRKREEVLAR